MAKCRILKEHERYEIIVTREFERTIQESFAQLEQRHGRGFAIKWHGKIIDFIETLRSPGALGVIDPENYSDHYVHLQVPDTQTVIFFLVEQDRIFLTASGYSGRNWSEVLKSIQPQIERQIKILKELP